MHPSTELLELTAKNKESRNSFRLGLTYKQTKIGKNIENFKNLRLVS